MMLSHDSHTLLLPFVHVVTTHVNNVIDLLGMELNTTAIERSWDFVMFKGYLLLNHDHNR